MDKTAADIQEDASISNDTIYGTSKHIADWSSQGFDPDYGTNFVAVHFEADSGWSLVAKAYPSQGTPTPSFTDDDVVVQITPETIGVEVTATKGEETVSGVFPLNMALESE